MDNYNIKTGKTVLLEASAGTGKTYSLAILYIKALFETKDITKILAVTFTEAAVEELKARVRKFIFALLDENAEDNDKLLEYFGERVTNNKLNDDSTQILEKSKSQVDLAPIYTIHGFCMELLGQFSAEIQHNRLATLDNDIDKILYPICYRYYSHHKEIEVKDLVEIAKKVIEGKKFAMDGYDYEGVKQYYYQKFDSHIKGLGDLLSLPKIRDIEEKEQNKIINFFSKYDLETQYIKRLKNQGGKKSLSILWDNYVPEFPTFIEKDPIFENIIEFISYLGVNKKNDKITQTKSKLNSFTYDDLIDLVYKATEDNSGLSKQIGENYPYVFIDEFQDTDNKQYTIFRNCFIKNEKTVYLIGDPKQAIYGFRGADIDAYLEAKNSKVNGAKIQHLSLTKNYRSSYSFIENQNSLFNALGKDSFFMKENITYQDVTANDKTKNSSDGIYFYNHFGSKSFNEKTVVTDIVARISELIDKRIAPSKIAILIRKGKYANSIRSTLAKANINYVYFQDESVFKTTEASFMDYFLSALIHPTHSSINRTLQLSLLKDFDLDNLSDLDQQEVYYRFLQWQQKANEGKIYVAVQKLIRYCRNEKNLLDESFITNVEQIAEILQEQQSQKSWEVESLLQWLKAQIMQSDAQTYNTRVSTDQEAVQLMTIHKAKGLEFDYVFLLGVEDVNAPKRDSKLYSYKKNSNSLFNIGYGLGKVDMDILNNYLKEEARRLFYVGITRAAKRCYIYSFSNKTFLDEIYGKIANHHQDTFYLIEQPQKEDDFKIINNKKATIENIKKEEYQGKLQKFRNPSFYKLSFSSLSDRYETIPIDQQKSTYEEGSFEEFIFDKMGKGKYVGDKLHHIFENISMGELKPKIYDHLFKSFNKKGKNKQGEEVVIDNSGHIEQLVKEIWQTSILFEGEKLFSIQDIVPENVFNEMEFNFPIEHKSTKDLRDLLEGYGEEFGFKITAKQLNNLKGLMNGFMDVFFQNQQNGKFYILDWKSNYLGDHINAYSKENVIEAMNLSNYHLQYLIYTVAAHKYLSKYYKDYDYDQHFGGAIYLFVRGVRKGKETGIFTHKPEKGLIEKMAKLMQ